MSSDEEDFVYVRSTPSPPSPPSGYEDNSDIEMAQILQDVHEKMNDGEEVNVINLDREESDSASDDSCDAISAAHVQHCETKAVLPNHDWEWGSTDESDGKEKTQDEQSKDPVVEVPVEAIGVPATSSSSSSYHRWYIKSGYNGCDLSPDCSIGVLSSSLSFDEEFLLVYEIVTVRHFYEAFEIMPSIFPVSERERVNKMAKEAAALINAYNVNMDKQKQTEKVFTKTFTVCQYVSEAVYEQIRIEQMIKSPYILFNEYMQCEPHERTTHAWRGIHHTYSHDVAKWLNKGLEMITDADVYAYLIWRSSTSIGLYDCVAGVKGISFGWLQINGSLIKNAKAIDKVMSEQTGDLFKGDRYAKMIVINLTKLFEDYGAKIYRVERAVHGELNTTNWIPVNSLDDCVRVQVALYDKTKAEGDNRRTSYWERVQEGGPFWTSFVPHGCVVLNRGYIPFDCIVLQ